MCCGSTSVEIFQSQQAGPGRPGLPEDEEQEEVRPGPELRAAGDDGPGEGQLRCGHRGCEGGQGGGTRGRPESLNTYYDTATTYYYNSVISYLSVN